MEVSLADAMGRIVSVYSPDKPWATMVRDAAAEFLDLLASRPAFARMALVEAPSSGERAFELYASGKRVLQSLLDRGRDDPVEEEAIPSSAGRAALAGAESLIVGQILAGNAERLRELLPDVVYITTVPYLGQDEALRQSREAEKLGQSTRRLTGVERAGARGRWRPPRGRHRLPPEVVSRSQRERLLEAAVRVVAEKGYAAATIGDLTKEAGVSRTTFYELFRGQGGLLPRRLRQRGRAARAARRSAPTSPSSAGRERAAAGLAALLEALAEEPASGAALRWSTSARQVRRAAPLPRGGAAADARSSRRAATSRRAAATCRRTPRGWRSAGSPA